MLVWTDFKFCVKKKFCSKKILGPNFFLCKHRLCVTNRFLVCSVIVDFGVVLLLLVLVLVTGVKQSQILVLRLSLEFDKKCKADTT